MPEESEGMQIQQKPPFPQEGGPGPGKKGGRDLAEEELIKRRQAMIQEAEKRDHRPPRARQDHQRTLEPYDLSEEERPKPGFIKKHVGHKHHGRGRRMVWKLCALLFVLILLLTLVLVFYPRVKQALTLPEVNISVPSSLEEMLPDEKMGYSRVDFTNAILGESRERQELIVLEQDVEVTTQVSQALANIALFAKTKTLVSYGTGVYTVSLKEIDDAAIMVDDERQLVTLTLPHAALQYIDFDVTKTESGETKKALLAFGDIKLTSEQDLELKTTIYGAMEERLSTPAMFTKADEAALKKVTEIFAPLITAVSPDYLFKAVMEQ